MTEPDEQDLTAHHEAGHAVAALACGGGLISITIGPTPEHPEFAGNTGVRVEKWWHLPFVAFDVNRDGDLDKYEQLEEGILPDGTRSEPPTARMAQILGAPKR